MATIDELRAAGANEVTLECAGRTYRGRILLDKLGDRAVNFLFVPSDAPGTQIVMTLDDVTRISER